MNIETDIYVGQKRKWTTSGGLLPLNTIFEISSVYTTTGVVVLKIPNSKWAYSSYTEYVLANSVPCYHLDVVPELSQSSNYIPAYTYNPPSTNITNRLIQLEASVLMLEEKINTLANLVDEKVAVLSNSLRPVLIAMKSAIEDEKQKIVTPTESKDNDNES